MTSDLGLRILRRMEADEAYLSQLGVLDPWTIPAELALALQVPVDDVLDAIEELRRNDEVIWLRSFGSDGHPIREPADQRRYRSRFAETFRVLSLLRQRFPGRAFEASPPLVDGLYWYAIPRNSPRRDLSFREVLSHAEVNTSHTPHVRDAIEILLDSWGDQALSGFQARTLQSIVGHTVTLRGQRGESSSARGAVVQAPTGAGKTRAFFMPAMLEPILRRLENEAWTPTCSIVAIYPRAALASDQLTAVLPLVRKLNDSLQRRGAVPISVGVAWGGQLYRWPPPDSSDQWTPNSSRDGGWTVNFIRCDACGARLHAPAAQSPPTLRCRDCHQEFPEIRYDWPGYSNRPPDILFAVTETLSRRMTDTRFTAVFGDASRRGPSLVLLDEVHLYRGLFGSQVASLVRRLRRRLTEFTAAPPSVIGLSATLQEAVSFFAALTGIEASDIEEIGPTLDELEVAGTEGVGFARASRRPPPIATAIQSAMAIGHAYLRDENLPAAERMFVFGDKLDLVHRLAYQLDNAEARQQLFQLRAPGPGVANLSPPHDCEACRSAPDAGCTVFQTGECWWFSTKTPGRALSVSAVSSIAREAERSRISVASPSLEVGIDDASVQSVIQYLSPPSASSFVQRRGRAGRGPNDRPLSLLILSELRPSDMFVFRNPWSLVSPALPPIPLNSRNMLARRTQAFARILDLFASSGRAKGTFALDQTMRDDGLQSFADWLSNERNLSEEISSLWEDEPRGGTGMQRLLWSEGTGLLTRVLPRLLRREGLGQQPSDMLSDFLPSALFSELKVPDFTVRRPGETADQGRQEELDIAFESTLPGNVTFRYSTQKSELPLWVPQSSFPDESAIQVDDVYELRETGVEIEPAKLPQSVFERVRSGAAGSRVPLLRPIGLKPDVLRRIRTQPGFGPRVQSDAWSVSPGEPPREGGGGQGRFVIHDSRAFSLARHWVERDQETGQPIDLLGEQRSGAARALGAVKSLVTQAEAYIAGENGGLATYKATFGVSSYATLARGRTIDAVAAERGFVTSQDRLRDVALGWSGRVDGLRFRIDVSRLRALGRDVIRSDRVLKNDLQWKAISREFINLAQSRGASVFDAERALDAIELAVIADDQSGDGITDFIERVRGVRPEDPSWAHAAADTWHNLYEVTGGLARPEDDTGEHGADDGAIDGHNGDGGGRSRTQQHTPDLIVWLRDHASLWHESMARLNDARWLQDRLDEIAVHSIARVLRVAAIRSSGANDSRDFLADDGIGVRSIAGETERELFVFETALEGSGLCQGLVASLQERPDAFGDQVATVVHECPQALRDSFLRAVVRRIDDVGVRDYVMAAQDVHNVRGVNELQRLHRSTFNEPLLDWQLAALRIKPPAVGEAIPDWWNISSDLVRLDDEIAATNGVTTPVGLLVWLAVRKSARDNGPPAVRALRNWLASRVPTNSLETTLASVLERFVLRGCADGCPDCIAGLPDEIEGSQRLASLLLSRRQLVAILEQAWVDDALVADDARHSPDVLVNWLLAACQRGLTDASVVVHRENLDRAIEMVEQVTDAGIPLGLREAPVCLRSARRLSDGRLHLVVGLAES